MNEGMLERVSEHHVDQTGGEGRAFPLPWVSVPKIKGIST